MANANQRKINGVGSGKSSSLLSSSTWEKSTALTMCLWLYEETSFPVTAFHTLLGGGRGTKNSVIQQTLVWWSPDLFHLPGTSTHAVKSAAPVAALLASLLRLAPHTAPLWPSNVPIQSPVSPWRSIGFPSDGEVEAELIVCHFLAVLPTYSTL